MNKSILVPQEVSVAPNLKPLMAKAIYRNILGGKQSDKLLIRRTLELIGPRILASKLLDVGVGSGINTERLLNLAPKELYVSDYQFETARSATERLQEVSSRTLLRPYKLDLKDPTTFENLEDHSFDVINCISVMMHLTPEEVEQAVKLLLTKLKATGKLLIAVICGDLARDLFIPAPSLGENKFFPRLKGLPENATEEDVPAHLHLLAENYPPNEFYRKVCKQNDYSVKEFDAIIGDECDGCVYEKFKGRPLWKLFLISYSPLI